MLVYQRVNLHFPMVFLGFSNAFPSHRFTVDLTQEPREALKALQAPKSASDASHRYDNMCTYIYIYICDICVDHKCIICMYTYIYIYMYIYIYTYIYIHIYICILHIYIWYDMIWYDMIWYDGIGYDICIYNMKLYTWHGSMYTFGIENVFKSWDCQRSSAEEICAHLNFRVYIMKHDEISMIHGMINGWIGDRQISRV